MFSMSRQMYGRQSESEMDKCERKWVYFKTYIPDVMNKSLIFRQQRLRSHLKIITEAENSMYTFTKLNVAREWAWEQVGSCHGWFPGGQLSMQLQKQRSQMLTFIYITCPQSSSQHLQDCHNRACKHLKLGKCWGRREEHTHLGDLLTSTDTPQCTG